MRTIVLGGLDVVDGAWADDDDEAVVGVIENGLHGLAGSDDGLPGRQREGELLAKTGGREKRTNVTDAGVLSALREEAPRVSSTNKFASKSHRTIRRFWVTKLT